MTRVFDHSNDHLKDNKDNSHSLKDLD